MLCTKNSTRNQLSRTMAINKIWGQVKIDEKLHEAEPAAHHDVRRLVPENNGISRTAAPFLLVDHSRCSPQLSVVTLNVNSVVLSESV